MSPIEQLLQFPNLAVVIATLVTVAALWVAQDAVIAALEASERTAVSK